MTSLRRFRRNRGFRYSPLDSGGKEIRLIRIIPDKDDQGRVSCELRHFHLKDNPYYECLSYVWGDPEKNRPILLNGINFNVTINLDGFLRQLQPKTTNTESRRWIWIDALCINQNDDQEKTVQVTNMIGIYRQAKQVLIWFGPADYTIDSTFHLLNRLSSDYPEPSHLAQYRVRSKALDQLLSETADDNDIWVKGLKRIASNAWWRRIWVIQEAAVAKKALVLHGPYHLNFDCLKKFWYMLNANALNKPGYLRSVKNSMHLLLNSCDAFTEHTPDLFTLLRSVHSGVFVEKFFKASEPRDFVYALSGSLKGKLAFKFLLTIRRRLVADTAQTVLRY
jgi:Heterokaryon incompatibility protein (HET)